MLDKFNNTASSPKMAHSGSTTPAPNLNLCERTNCDDQKDRPNLATGATVFVVFGIKDVNRTGLSRSSVITEKVWIDSIYCCLLIM